MIENLVNEWTINEWVLLVLLLLLGYLIKYSFRKFNSYDYMILNLLFFYHIFMSMIFTWYINKNWGDAKGYWNITKELNNEKVMYLITNDPTKANLIYILNYVPSKLLDLSFLSGNLIYGIIGYFGVLLLYHTVKDLFPLNKYLNRVQILNIPIFPLLLFLPNFHFWSSGIGKDTISFFCVCSIIYGLVNIKRRWGFVFIGLFLTYLVRPHVTLLLIGSFSMAFILKSNLLAIQKAFILLILVGISVPILLEVVQFAKMDDASLDSFQSFSDKRATALKKNADSSVDISGLPYPLKVFTFLYRPLFFDGASFLGLLSSVENLVWLVLSFNFISNKPVKTFKTSHYIFLGGFIYWFVGALAFAPVFGNLGIIVRERNMFLPAFILFAIAGLASSKKFKKMEWYLYNYNRG